MWKLSLVVFNLISLIIPHISRSEGCQPKKLCQSQENCGNIQFEPKRQTGIVDPSGPVQELGFKSLQKNLRSEGCRPKRLCQSQEDCGTDGICYISYEDPYLGKIRFLSVYFCIKKCILYIWITF